MDVKFISVISKNLGTVPIVDGQVIGVADKNAFYYDMNSNRRRVGGINQVSTLKNIGVGNSGEVYIIDSGDDKGIYVWDEDNKAFILIGNENTDEFLTIVKNDELSTGYLLATNGKEGSDEIYYNTNVQVDLKTSSVTATTFNGKATDSKHADNATKAVNADKATNADVAAKLGTANVGSTTRGIYLSQGTPTQCGYTVEKNVPANAVFTDTTYKNFTGATETTNGTNGLVLAPSAGQNEQFLKGDGTWSDVVTPVMEGCTKTENGTSGLVPTPTAGRYNSFLKGDGTWAGYSAGYGLNLQSLTFNLEESGAEAGTYGPIPNSIDGNYFIPDEDCMVYVPQIQVDIYGRVVSIKNIPVKLPVTETKGDPTMMTFHVENGRLYVTYDDYDTALATFYVDGNGNLVAQYNYDEDYGTFVKNDDGTLSFISNE